MPLDELRALLARHARADGTTAIDGVLIGRAERAYQSSASMSGTVLALIAQGAKTLALGERVYEYHAGQYLIASIDLPVTGHYTEASRDRPALGFGLTLQPSAIADLLLQAPAGDRRGPAAAHRPRWPSAMRRPSSSTRRYGCCACSTSHATSRCSRR